MGNEVYKTQFPSKMELQRAIRFGTFQVKNTTCSIEFSEWSSSVQPSFRLEDVWILISGVPEGMIGDYLALWGLGGLVGKTKAVDMPYTNWHGVVRSLIKVVDIAHIPYKKNYVYKDEGYTLTFELEDDVSYGEDEEMDDANLKDDDGKDDQGNEKKSLKDLADSQNLDKSGQKSAAKTGGGGVSFSAPIMQTTLLSPSIQFGSFSNKWADMVEEVPSLVTSVCLGHEAFTHSDAAQIEDGNQKSIDSSKLNPTPPEFTPMVGVSPFLVAADMLPVFPVAAENFAVFSNATEIAMQEVRSHVSPVATKFFDVFSAATEKTPQELAGQYAAKATTTNILEPILDKAVILTSEGKGNHDSFDVDHRVEQPLVAVPEAHLTPQSPMRPIASLLSPISPMTMSGRRGPRQAPTMEEVVAFGGIKDVSVGLRSSERIRAQPLADATQLERAVHMAQLRDSPGMLSKSKLSILNIPMMK